ncbi:thiamine phosphate synthase [Pyruvatibacter mobilis]|uniref:thiamine phosphate synthase n=1 Tax=Pyruvatibacter mobilis TaxID=1712261 RepID=UPI003C7E5D9A
MTDETAQGPATDLAHLVPAGSILCLRDYDHPDRTALAGDLARICRKRSLRLLIGGDVELALEVNAFGVHVPEGLWRGRRGQIRKARAGGLRVTTAVHSSTVARAARSGPLVADAVTLSPVFETKSHPGAHTLGPLGLSKLLREVAPLPAYALGGIHTGNARRAMACAGSWPNLVGVAGIRFQP